MMMTTTTTTKRIFQNVATGLWYDGSGFRVNREEAFQFPTSVVLVDFRYNFQDVEVRSEDVEVVEHREVVEEAVFEANPWLS